jgi:hypothetical protein
LIEREALGELDAQVEADMRNTAEQFERNKGSVIEMLIEQITKISLEVPLVVQGKFEAM